MPYSSDQSGTLDTSPSSTSKTVSPHLSHDIHGRLDPPWLIQVLEFPWRNLDHFEHHDWRNDDHFEQFDLLIWLVDRLYPISCGALRRVHPRIRRIFPDATFFEAVRITPRMRDPFKHLSKKDLYTIGQHCRELRILFDAAPSKETVLSGEGHDDGEDWTRILKCLPNTAKIILRTTKGPGDMVRPGNIDMLTQPFRQNFQYAAFLQNLKSLKLGPMHIPYIVNFCSLGTDCKTADWTLDKTWSQITELECQFFVQKDGGNYEVPWENTLQVLHRWLRGFKKNVRTLKFHWITAKNSTGPRPHPLALEKWLPEKREFVESPLVWNALKTLGIGNVELNEDDADSEVNLLDSRVPNVERYYRLRNAFQWERVDFAFESHESKYWKRYDRLANGRWLTLPGAERPQQIRSLQQPLRSQPISPTRLPAEESSTHRSSISSRTGSDFAQHLRTVGPFYLQQSSIPTPLSPKESPGQPGNHRNSFENSSTHRPRNTSSAGSFNFSQEFSPKTPTSQHSSAIRPPAPDDTRRPTRTNSRPTQHHRFENMSPAPRSRGLQTAQSPVFSSQGQSSFAEEMDRPSSRQQWSRSSGALRAGSGQSSPMSPRSGPVGSSNSKPLFVFDHDDEDSVPQQQPNHFNNSSREDSGFSPPNSPSSQRFGASIRQATGANGPRTGSDLESRQLPKLEALIEAYEDHSLDPESHPLQQQPSRNYGGSKENSEISRQTYQVSTQPQRIGYSALPRYGLTSADSRGRLNAVIMPEAHGHDRVYEEHSRRQPDLVTNIGNSASQLQDLNDGSRRDFESRNPRVGSLTAKSSVSSKYSTQTITVPRTQSNSKVPQRPRRPSREATLETHEDRWSQGETLLGGYEQGNYVSRVKSPAMASYDEFIGNPFVDESSGPSGAQGGNFTPPDSMTSQPQLTYLTTTRHSGPPEATQPLVSMEDQAPRRRSVLDAPEVVPAPVGPLLPEEHVAMYKRNGLHPGVALVQPQNFGAPTGSNNQEQLRRQFGLDNPSITLDNRVSAPEPEQPSRPCGKERKAKRRHNSGPVESVRGDDVSALSAKESERRSRENILKGSYFPTNAKASGSKTGFFRKVFKRRDSEESTTSKTSRRDSKASNGSDSSGKRRSFGKKVKDSVKVVKESGKSWGSIVGDVTGLR